MTKTKLLDIAIFAFAYWIIRLLWEYLQDGVPGTSFVIQEALIGIIAGFLVHLFTSRYRNSQS